MGVESWDLVMHTHLHGPEAGKRNLDHEREAWRWKSMAAKATAAMASNGRLVSRRLGCARHKAPIEPKATSIVPEMVQAFGCARHPRRRFRRLSSGSAISPMRSFPLLYAVAKEASEAVVLSALEVSFFRLSPLVGRMT